jgi:hypothetical protein
MIDQGLRRDIQRLVDEMAPPAPWLEERVLRSMPASVRASRRARHGRSSGSVIAGWAATAIAALLVGLLIGSRMAAEPTPATHVSPSRDASVLQYRALVNADIRNLESVYKQGCYTRQACTRQIESTRSATEGLLRDLSTTPPPPHLAAFASRLTIAAQRFDAELGASLQVIAQPGSNFIAASLNASTLDIDSAVAALDCWPATASAIGDELDAGFSCS